MRGLAAFIALTLCVPATAADNPHAILHKFSTTAGAAMNDPRCSPTRSYVAGADGSYRGEKLAPKKLTELPPGTVYMAVFRHIGGCEAPLTMVEYRNPRR
jgi:hypothetical protein